MNTSESFDKDSSNASGVFETPELYKEVAEQLRAEANKKTVAALKKDLLTKHNYSGKLHKRLKDDLVNIITNFELKAIIEEQEKSQAKQSQQKGNNTSSKRTPVQGKSSVQKAKSATKVQQEEEQQQEASIQSSQQSRKRKRWQVEGLADDKLQERSGHEPKRNLPAFLKTKEQETQKRIQETSPVRREVPAFLRPKEGSISPANLRNKEENILFSNKKSTVSQLQQIMQQQNTPQASKSRQGSVVKKSAAIVSSASSLGFFDPKAATTDQEDKSQARQQSQNGTKKKGWGQPQPLSTTVNQRQSSSSQRPSSFLANLNTHQANQAQKVTTPIRQQQSAVKEIKETSRTVEFISDQKSDNNSNNKKPQTAADDEDNVKPFTPSDFLRNVNQTKKEVVQQHKNENHKTRVSHQSQTTFNVQKVQQDQVQEEEPLASDDFQDAVNSSYQASQVSQTKQQQHLQMAAEEEEEDHEQINTFTHQNNRQQQRNSKAREEQNNRSSYYTTTNQQQQQQMGNSTITFGTHMSRQSENNNHHGAYHHKTHQDISFERNQQRISHAQQSSGRQSYGRQDHQLSSILPKRDQIDRNVSKSSISEQVDFLYQKKNSGSKRRTIRDAAQPSNVAVGARLSRGSKRHGSANNSLLEISQAPENRPSIFDKQDATMDGSFSFDRSYISEGRQDSRIRRSRDDGRPTKSWFECSDKLGNLLFFSLIILIVSLVAKNQSALATSVLYCPSAMNQQEIKSFRSLQDDELCPETTEYRNCETFRYCIDCPVNGVCDNQGFLNCASGFVRLGNECIESAELPQAANQVVENLQSELQLQRGRFDCGDESTFTMKMSDFEDSLRNEFAGYSSDTWQNHFNVDTLTKKVYEVLNNGEYDVQWVRSGQQLSNTRTKTERLDGFNSQNMVLYSINSTHSFNCRMKLFIRDYIFALILFFAFSLILFYYFRRWMANRRLRKLAQGLYHDVRAKLSTSSQIQPYASSGLTQNDILRMFLSQENRGDSISRNEATFYMKIWPQMEQIRRRERKVTTFSRTQFGREIEVWQLKN